MKDIVLEVKNLKTYFYTNSRCNRAINGVSFNIKKGKTLCVVGESGCGKSVTASSIMQLLPKLGRIEEGEILYYGDDKITNIATLHKNSREMRKLRGSDIAMIFQDPMNSLNPVYTVGFQLMEAIMIHQNVTKKEARKRAIELLGEMGIPLPEKRVDEYPHQYSGGMRQRAMIAMAMSCEPSVLIADEPTTALDVTIQAQIFDLVDRLKKKNNTAVMMITHDMGVVTEMADDVAVMYMGNIIEFGTVDEVLRNPSHPYTKALLSSIPILGRGRNQEIEPIRGVTPDPYDRPKGCQFEPRCNFATEQCKTKVPEETSIETSHMVRCFHYKEVGNYE